MLAAVPTGMSAAFREISTLTLPDSAVDAAIAPHNYTGNVSRICGGLMRARSEGQLRIVVLGTSMAAGAARESQGVLSTVAHEPAPNKQPQVRTELLRRPEVAEKPPARAAAVTPAVSYFLNARDQL